MSSPILQPGRNCWRREHADRFAFLVNGAPYFAAVKRALLAAREQVFIVGWDIDSRIRLERRDPMEGVPDQLLALIDHVARARPTLRIHVLIWDFTVLYAGDREPLPAFRLNWQTPANVTARFDDALPFGGAQHQKIVAVDDRLAFVGGLDLTEGRWDTAEHAENDPCRVDSDGVPFGPYHDVMAMFDGPAAAAVGALARHRWCMATGEEIPPPPGKDNGDPWPDTVTPDITDLDVAIARTRPPIDEAEEVREVEALFLDSIRAAKHLIFIENQYFTARAATEALCDRLSEENGPEVVIVLPDRYDSWIEDETMGAGLARAARRLRQADCHGRLRLLAPRLSHRTGLRYTIHAKVMTVDDRLVRVGSANLNNRSMSIDSECDIAVEAAGNPRIAGAVAAFRHRLLAEHCGLDADGIARKAAEHGSLVAALDALDREGRCLAPLDTTRPDTATPEAVNSFVDPEKPADFSEFAGRVTRIEFGLPGLTDALRRGWPLLAMIAAMLALAAGWRFTPLGEWLDPAAAADMLEAMRRSPLAPLLAVGLYVMAGFVLFPLTVLVAATAIAFGPWLGFAYAFAGAMTSATATFAIGALAGRRPLRRLLGRRLRTLDRHLARSGVLAVMTVRLIPLAPFSVVNLAAGAARLRARDFLIGSALGLAPGIVVMTALGDRLEALLRNPDPLNIAAVAGLLLVWLMAGVGIQRLLRGRLRGRAAKDATGRRDA